MVCRHHHPQKKYFCHMRIQENGYEKRSINLSRAELVCLSLYQTNRHTTTFFIQCRVVVEMLEMLQMI